MARRAIALMEAHDWIHSELQRHLARYDLDVVSFPGGALDNWSFSRIELFLIGNTRDDPSYAIAAARRVREANPWTPVFLLAWTSSEQLAIAALKDGVSDYFAPPIDLGLVAAAVRRIATGRAGRDLHTKNFEAGGRTIIGDSLVMRDLRSYVRRVAARECNMLVLAETGTGKGLVAEAIHTKQFPKSETVCLRELRRDSGRTVGERTVWLRKGRL